MHPAAYVNGIKYQQDATKCTRFYSNNPKNILYSANHKLQKNNSFALIRLWCMRDT